MSLQAMVWALDQHIPLPAAKLVLLSIANYADSESGEAWPALNKLVEETSLDRRTIQRHIGWLEGEGLLEKMTREGRGGRQTTNLYRLKLSAKRRGGKIPPLPEGGTVPPLGVAPVTPLGAAPVSPLEPITEPVNQTRESAGANASEQGQDEPAGKPLLSTGGKTCDDFMRAYGGCAHELGSPIREEWADLTPKERQAAFDGIAAFIEDRKASGAGGKRLMAVTYLAERKWTLISSALVAKAKAAGPAPDGSQITTCWSREFMASLLHKVHTRKPVTFMCSHANDRKNKEWPLKAGDLPPPEIIERFKGYPVDGDVVKRWRPWFNQHGVHLNLAGSGWWLQLPSEDPPPTGVTLWDWVTQRQAG